MTDPKEEKKEPNKNEKKVEMNLNKETAKGSYNNLVITNFTREEFVLDFGFVQPNTAKGEIQSRIILSPKNAKRLAQALTKNIQEYEKKCGRIDDNIGPAQIKFSNN